MAARLGGRAGLLRRQPRARRRAGRRLLHARDAPVPLGPPAHGARPQLHAGRRRHALQAPPGAAGPAADGLRLLRPACRERGDQGRRSPARDRRGEHRSHRNPDAAAGVGDRLGSRDRRARARVLPLDAMALPQVLREGARLPQGSAGQLVPERPDRPGQRAGDQRALRALRRGGRVSQDGAVVLPDHGLRGCAAEGPRADRLARAYEGDPAQLDRPFRGRRAPVPNRRARLGRARLHHAARHGLRRDVLPARSRAPAGGHPRRALAERGRGPRVRAQDDGQARRGAGCGRGEDGRLHGPLRRQPRHGRADSRLGGRLRADGLRHRRDHGRARPRRARRASSRSATACRSERSWTRTACL